MADKQKKRIDNFEWLSNVPDSVIKMPPVAVGETDRKAGKLLALLYDEILPDNATVGEAEAVLSCALWWTNTMSVNKYAKRILEQKGIDPEEDRDE